MREILAALTALVILCSYHTAHATPQCGRHADQAASLGREFGEVLQSQGLTGEGFLAQTYVNPRTGSWTVMLIRPDGVACLLTAGEQFEAVMPGEPA